MLRTLFDEPNKRATPGAENTANKQRPVDIYDAKLKNYIHIICAGGSTYFFHSQAHEKMIGLIPKKYTE